MRLSPATPSTANAKTYSSSSKTTVISSSSSKATYRPRRSPAHCSDRFPPFACETKDRGHGRIECQKIQVHPIEPIACGLPHVRSLVVITKQTSSTSPGVSKESKETVSHYLGSLIPQSAQRFARLVRGRWGGCEIRNHWVRDAQLEEDATRSKNLNLKRNLAVSRCGVIALKARHASHLSWPTIFELSSLRPAILCNLVCNHAIK